MPVRRDGVDVSTEIDAPAEVVWRVLSDLDSYSERNPYFVSATGELAEGATVEVRAALAGRRPVRTRCRVVSVQPDRRLRWRSRLVLPGVPDADHTFDLSAQTPQRTELRQHETCTGLLAAAAPRDGVHAACSAMAEALRVRAEARAAAS